MKISIGSILALIALFASSVIAHSQQVPSFPKNFVGIPEFRTTEGSRSAGTASLVKIAGSFQAYFVTVRHLLGPAGGFAQQVSQEQVPNFVSSISLTQLWGGAHTYNVQGLSVQKTTDENDPLFEIAAFKASDANSDDAVTISPTLPSVGSPIWIIAHVRGGVPQGQYMHPAKVTDSGQKWLVCEFDNPQIITNGASGAPVINSEGQLVGVYKGHITRNGKPFAYIIPSPLIIKVIQGIPIL